MGPRDPHAVLGVDAGATTEEIHEAYVRTVKRIHPDNFDRQRQPDLWREANKALAELNDAFERLGGRRQNAERHERPHPRVDVSAVAGECIRKWRPSWSMPDSEYEGFIRGHMNVGEFAAEVASAMKSRPNLTEQDVLGECLSILRQREPLLRKSMGHWYLNRAMRTRHDAVQSFNRSTPRMAKSEIPSAIGRLITLLEAAAYLLEQTDTLDPQCRDLSDAHELLAKDLSEARRAKALAETRTNGVHSTSDASASSAAQTRKVRRRRPSWLTPVIISAAIYGMLVLIVVLRNTGGARTSGQTQARNATPSSYSPKAPIYPAHQSPPTAPPVYPAMPLPENGYIWKNHSREEVAPLEIVTAPGSGNFYAKLVNLARNKWTLAVFVREGQSVSIHVPLGTYELRYATGATWYGRTHLFGPQTSYHKAESLLHFRIEGDQAAGYTVELYKQVNGNLETSDISASAWGDDAQSGSE
jgi:curved DNA-binding protein CbpA/biotin carboxyl carrier protein